MSASKLEIKIWNLEKRLREDWRKDVQSLACRLDHLEAQLSMQSETESQEGGSWNPEDHVEEEDNEDVSVPRASQKFKVSKPLAVVPVEDGEGELGALAGPHLEDLDDLEPVAFSESTWNLVLILGDLGETESGRSGWLEMVLGGLMLLISAGVQITFSIVLLSKDFLGDPFFTEIAAAKSWRWKVAHDYTHMDLAKTSLVSRVCNQAEGLIVANDQETLIRQINAFLGLGKQQFEPEGLRPGTLLCMLCILLWCLYLCYEFRRIFESVEAVCRIPRAWKTKVVNGEFIVMSHVRFLIYCVMQLASSVIAGVLLYAGVIWLANTTSIEDLMLNAVALVVVLDVDAMFFASLMPKNIQIRIQELEAIKITYSRRRSQGESIFLVLAIIALLLCSLFFLVEPLSESMRLVKLEYCAGYQDFVVVLNQNLGIPVAHRTTPWIDAKKNESSVEFAVGHFLAQDFTHSSSHLRFAFSTRDFETKRTETVVSAARNMAACVDLDQWYLQGVEGELYDLYGPLWWSTAMNLGMSNSSSCADMSGFCHSSQGYLLRLVCPVTCGCASPHSNPWFKVTAQGCPQKCETLRAAALEAMTPCADIAVDGDFNWADFWMEYPDIMAEFLSTAPDASVDPNVTAVVTEMTNGCASLNAAGLEPLTRASWCQGNSDLWSPLAYLCPVSCGCQSEDKITQKPAWCPSACTSSTASADSDPTAAPDAADPTDAPDVTDPTNAPDVTDPTNAPEAADPTDAPDTADPTDAPDAADPTDAPDAADPTDAPDAADPTDAPDAADPTDAPDAADPTDAPDAADPTDAPEVTTSTSSTDAADPTSFTATSTSTSSTDAADPTTSTATSTSTISTTSTVSTTSTCVDQDEVLETLSLAVVVSTCAEAVEEDLCDDAQVAPVCPVSCETC